MTAKNTFDFSHVEDKSMLPLQSDLKLHLQDKTYKSFCKVLSLTNNRYWLRYYYYMLHRSAYEDIDYEYWESFNEYAFPQRLIQSAKYRREKGYFSHDFEVTRVMFGIYSAKFVEVKDPYVDIVKEANSLADTHLNAFIGKDFVPTKPSIRLPNVENGIIYNEQKDVYAYRLKGISTVQDLIKFVKDKRVDIYDMAKSTLGLIIGSGLVLKKDYDYVGYLDYDWDSENISFLRHMTMVSYTIKPEFERFSRTIISKVHINRDVVELPPVAPSEPIPDIKLEREIDYDMRNPNTYMSELATMYVSNNYESRVQAIKLIVSYMRFPQGSKFLLYGDGAGTGYVAFKDKYDVVAFDPSPKMVEIAESKGNPVELGGLEVFDDGRYKDYYVFISHVMNVDNNLLQIVLERGKTILFETARFNGFSKFKDKGDGLYTTVDLDDSFFGTILPSRKVRPPANYHDFSHELQKDSYVVGIDLQYPEFLFKSWYQKGLRVRISRHYKPMFRFVKGLYELAVLYGHKIVSVNPDVLLTDVLVVGLRNFNVLRGYDTFKGTLITSNFTFENTFGKIVPLAPAVMHSPVFLKVSEHNLVLPIKHSIKNYHRARIGDIVYLTPGRYQVSGRCNYVFEVK